MLLLAAEGRCRDKQSARRPLPASQCTRADSGDIGTGLGVALGVCTVSSRALSMDPAEREPVRGQPLAGTAVVRAPAATTGEVPTPPQQPGSGMGPVSLPPVPPLPASGIRAAATAAAAAWAAAAAASSRCCGRRALESGSEERGATIERRPPTAEALALVLVAAKGR